jgi:Flp pilus assembly protein TadD
VEAHYNLGIALGQMGDVERAAEQFRTVLRLHPDDASAEANLGAALAQMQRYPEAKQHLERALELDPHQADAKDNLEALKKLMNGQ